jgi:hypothetical protein
MGQNCQIIEQSCGQHLESTHSPQELVPQCSNRYCFDDHPVFGIQRQGWPQLCRDASLTTEYRVEKMSAHAKSLSLATPTALSFARNEAKF